MVSLPRVDPKLNTQNSGSPVGSQVNQAPAGLNLLSPAGADPASLGTYTETVERLAQAAQLKQDLLHAAKELLPHERRLQACLALTVDRKQPVAVEYAGNVDRARLTNVCRCDNPWLCPNCGPIIAEIKRQFLQDCLVIWKTAGFTSVFVVFTLQHFLFEALAVVDKRIDRAVKMMFDSPAGRRFKAKWSINYRQKSPDLTYGQNGWHSHRNFIFYLERRPLSPEELSEFEFELRYLWVKYCQAVGGYCDLEHGCKVRGGDIFDVADYISSKAMGCGGSGKPAAANNQAAGSRWGLPEEMTKNQAKQARQDGFTPTGLLLAYLWGDSPILSRDMAGWLWREYASVFKGKHFVDSSAGLRERLDTLKEQYKDELAGQLGQDEKPEYKPVCYLSFDAWAMLVKAQIALLLLAEVKRCRGDVYAVQAFLDGFGIDQGVWYPDLEPIPPDWILPQQEGLGPEQLEAIRALDEFMREWNWNTA